jgi:hypothetical protein
MKRILSSVNGAAKWAAHKSGASVRLAAGITGDVVATGVGIVGGAIAVTGGIVAAVGVGTYAGGVAVMRGADILSRKSMDVTEKAYDDLVATAPVEEHHAKEEVPPAPPLFVDSPIPDFAPA